MDDRIEKLKNLSNDKLLDVIKNYKRYNYPKTFQQESLRILNERGFSEDSIKLSGGHSNLRYEEAARIFNRFKWKGRIGIGLFFLSIFFYSNNDYLLQIMVNVIFLLVVVLMLNDRKEFFRTIKEEESDRSNLGYLITFLLSIPMFIIVYIVDRIELKNKLEQLP
ncbi:hypothetical protein [Moheibacter stercoris]|uniref:DUF2812 domain-containing protein n=1 Tax=Moheibacter stercoris TaxID=1628251 RepID=A0ABV2LT52_9FLAO